jgi:hypothetical protein
MASDIRSHWEIRIEATREAQARSRFALLASTLVSVAILIAVFNAEFSWIRNIAIHEMIGPPGMQSELTKEVVDEWIRSQRISISTLGVNVAASDVSIFGSSALFVLSIWYFFCIRRENHLIGNLLIDAKKSNDTATSLSVFHGISSYTVFTTIGEDDDPIDSLQRQPPVRRRIIYLRWSFIWLVWLPALTIAFMLATDITSLILPSAVRDSQQSLWDVLSHRERVQAISYDVFDLLFSGLVANLCMNVVRCERATKDILRQFNEYLFEPRVQTAAAA